MLICKFIQFKTAQNLLTRVNPLNELIISVLFRIIVVVTIFCVCFVIHRSFKIDLKYCRLPDKTLIL